MTVDILGLVLAAAALFVAVLAWREARRSAHSSERSASASERSAGSAESSAAEAARMSTVEIDRRHDELRPHVHTFVPLHSKPSRISDWRELREVFGVITVPRDYRVVGTFHQGQGHSTLSFPLLLRAGQPAEFHLGTVERADPVLVGEVRFQFWPPQEVDGVDPWTCPCARPDTAKQPHWEVVSRVDFERSS